MEDHVKIEDEAVDGYGVLFDDVEVRLGHTEDVQIGVHAELIRRAQESEKIITAYKA